MEDNNGRFLVYKRRRKFSSLEADHRLKKTVEFDKSGMEHHGGAPTSDAQIGSAMVQETPKEVKNDQLLVLREVLQKSMEEEAGKPKQINDEDSTQVQQVAPLYTPSGLAMKQKYAELRKRQKGRLQLRNAGNEPLPSSRKVGAKQRFDPETSKMKGSNVPCSCSMSLMEGKGIAVPNAALPNKVNVSGSGLQLSTSLNKNIINTDVKGKGIALPSAALPNKLPQNDSASGLKSNTSFNKNLEATPLIRRRPAGFLKRNTKPNDWSELELDALWVGVRRYGQGNWGRILTDPVGFIFKNRTPQDLSVRWQKELLKIFPLPQPTTSIFPPAVPSLRIGSSHLGPNNNNASSLTTPQGPLLNANLQPRLMFQKLHDQSRPMAALQTPVMTMTGNWFPTRTHHQPNNIKMDSYNNVRFPWIKDYKNNNNNHNNAGRPDHPIVVDSDSEKNSGEGGSEATLSA